MKRKLWPRIFFYLLTKNSLKGMQKRKKKLEIAQIMSIDIT